LAGSHTNTEQARRYVVRGRVQGVGFRYFVEDCAQRLGLVGYVKNRFDGTVEVYAVGNSKQLAALKKHLWSGPRFGRVENVEESDAPVQARKSFAIEF
jgi:acylphosphatase